MFLIRNVCRAGTYEMLSPVQGVRKFVSEGARAPPCGRMIMIMTQCTGTTPCSYIPSEQVRRE